MKSFNEWAIVYEDKELIAKRNPEYPEEYGLYIKNTENYLILPRGCLENIALADRNRGRVMIDLLGPYYIKNFFENNTLNYDSLIAVIDKTYIKEKERIQKLLDQK